MKRHFSDWITAYVELFDPITECPSKLHFWTAVSMIGGALTRRVSIDEVTFAYYPSFCIIFVAPPGVVSKSTTVNHGVALLKELPQTRFADDNTTYPEFVKALAAADQTISINDDVDPTKVQWIRQCAMTVAISELGTFLKVEDEDSINCLTDLLDCRNTYIKSTKHNGRDEIEFPFVNVVGATTPSWIQDKLKAQIGGWGLSSRIIFVYADTKKQLIWSPAEVIANKTAFDRTKALLVDDLAAIGKLAGTLKLDKKAASLCKDWYEGVQKYNLAYNDSPDYDNWTGYFLARKYIHMRKLAMVLSISRGDSLVISRRDVEKAIECVEEVEKDILFVFRPKAQPSKEALEEQAVLDRLIQEVKASGEMSKRAVLSRAARFMDSSAATRIVDNAIARGVFESQHKTGGGIWLSLPPAQVPAETDC